MSSVCEASIRESIAHHLETGKESFSELITILSMHRFIDDTLITFLDKVRAAGSYVRYNPIEAKFSQEEVDYFLEGSYEVIHAMTGEEIPDRDNILYYSTKEDYERRLREMKSENDKIIKSLSDKMIKLKEKLSLFEESSADDDPDYEKDMRELKRQNARLEEELDVAVSVAEDLEEKLYMIQEEMEKLRTEQFIEKTLYKSKNKLRPKDFTTRDILNAQILANKGIQNIKAQSGKEYEAVKLIMLMENGETATGIVRGMWSKTAIHLTRNDRVNFINVYTPNWKEARVFHVFDKYMTSDIDYPVSYMVIAPNLLYSATDISAPVLKNDIFCTNIDELSNRSKENELTPPMLKGILVNTLVDEYFIQKEDFDFERVAVRIMEERKLELCYASEELIEKFYRELRLHYENLKSLFPMDKQDEWFNIFEPYMISPKFGLEGRIDMIYFGDSEEEGRQEKTDAIYEVKSGSPHTEHSYQLIAYRLLYQSCFTKRGVDTKLLYTKPGLRKSVKSPFIPVTKGKKLVSPSQMVINLRNHLTLIDMMRGSVEDRTCPEVPTYMKDESLCSRCTFMKKECLYQRDLFRSIESKDEITYYNGFMKLINRNELISRYTASVLWEKTTEEKVNLFSIINGLKIVRVDGQEVKLSMKEGNTSDFKVGDNAFLHRESVTEGLLFKCTILNIKSRFITVKLFKAFVSGLEKMKEGWTLDKAAYLTGSQKERNGMFRFITSHQSRNDDGRFKKLILGEIRPEFDEERKLIKHIDIDQLNSRQLEAVQKSASANDYFLIQGPPGTGKSYTLAMLVLELVKRGEKVLLTGFTNRSVDNALSILKDDLGFTDFARIGSYYSIDEGIKPFSTNAIANRYTLAKLSELKTEVEAKSVIASTAFSVDNFVINNIHFDTVIVDESSQMTEPATLLVVSRGERFILFGDHKQLPPVVNSEQLTEVAFKQNERELKSIDRSLFERLVRLNDKWAKEDGTSPASVMLNIQYRMNKEIADFPNLQFYEGNLLSAPDNARRVQEIDLKRVSKDHLDMLHPKRPIVFVNTRSKMISKENREEAKVVRKIITEMLKASVPKSEIGVITPYKAQCALIRREIDAISEHAGMEGEDIIVDTVERYQGGHKEVIIVSFTVGDNTMMSFLAEDNTDERLNRRLNVAITRARSKLILVGNKSVLAQDKVYRSMINHLGDKGWLFEAITDEQLELDMLF